MQSRQINPGGKERTFALIFQTGDEVISNLESFARQHQRSGSHFTAIGAFSDATLAYFEWEIKDYNKIPVREQVEVLTLTGDIATDQQSQQSKVHAHVVLGK